MSATTKWQGHAGAKINLNLEVTGRRSDGYHLINSLFLRLRWGDDLTIDLRPASKLHISVEVKEQPELCGPKNLAHKAAYLYLKRAGIHVDAQIALEKNIWVAAGLGGGSSDAALVLSFLNGHYNRMAPLELERLALELGADVPYFLYSGAAQVSGIGEEITPVTNFPKLHVLLVNPDRPLNTAEVFAKFSAGIPPRKLPKIPALNSRYFWRDPAPWVFNHLQPTAFEMVSELSDIMGFIRDTGSPACGMSGSGPTLFAIYREQAAAEKAGAQLRKVSGLKIQITETC